MASEKRLRSVGHSIAHHAVSGLSWVHPHLRQACIEAGMDDVTIDLLADEPCVFPPCTSGSPLDRALRSLQDRFEEILALEGFGLGDLTSASLFFEFPRERDDYYSICTSRIISSSGKRMEYTVSASGETLTRPLDTPDICAVMCGCSY